MCLYFHSLCMRVCVCACVCACIILSRKLHQLGPSELHTPLVSSSLSVSVFHFLPLFISLCLFSLAPARHRHTGGTLLAVSINKQRSSSRRSSSRVGFVTMLTESLFPAPASGAGSQDSLLRADGALSLLVPAKSDTQTQTRAHMYVHT